MELHSSFRKKYHNQRRNSSRSFFSGSPSFRCRFPVKAARKNALWAPAVGQAPSFRRIPVHLAFWCSRSVCESSGKWKSSCLTYRRISSIFCWYHRCSAGGLQHSDCTHWRPFRHFLSQCWKTEIKAWRNVLHRPEWNLADSMDGMGSGCLCQKTGTHPFIWKRDGTRIPSFKSSYFRMQRCRSGCLSRQRHGRSPDFQRDLHQSVWLSLLLLLLLWRQQYASLESWWSLSLYNWDTSRRR